MTKIQKIITDMPLKFLIRLGPKKSSYILKQIPNDFFRFAEIEAKMASALIPEHLPYVWGIELSKISINKLFNYAKKTYLNNLITMNKSIKNFHMNNSVSAVKITDVELLPVIIK